MAGDRGDAAPLRGHRGGEEARAPLSALLFPVTPREDAETMVGRSATEVARLASLAVSSSTSLLVVRLDDISSSEPLSGPKLCPVVGFVQVQSEDRGLRFARIILEHGGAGHTAVVHSNDAAVERFATELPVRRLLVNSPATQGAWGV